MSPNSFYLCLSHSPSLLDPQRPALSVTIPFSSPSHACHNEDTRRGDERAPRQRIGWPCPPLSSLNCFCLHHHHPCSKAAEAYGIPKAQAILPHCLASPSFSEELLVLSLGLSDPSAMSSSQHEEGEGQQEKLRDNHNMERPQKRWLLRYQAAVMRGRYDGKRHEESGMSSHNGDGCSEVKLA